MQTRLQPEIRDLARARLALDVLALGLRGRALDDRARGLTSAATQLEREAASLEAIARLPHLTPGAALELDQLATHYAWLAADRVASVTTLQDVSDAAQLARAAKALRRLGSLLDVAPAPALAQPSDRPAEG